MQTIKLFFLLMIFVLSANAGFAQDEFYNESNDHVKNDEQIELISDTEKEDLNNYSTEQDYVMSNNEEVTREEVYQEDMYIEEEEERRRKRQARAEFIGEVVFDVFINAVFIVATFWQ